MAAGTRSTDSGRRESPPARGGRRRDAAEPPTSGGAASLRELARGAAWLVGIAAVVRGIELLAGSSPLAALVLGAAAVELAATRAGVRWGPADRAAARAPAPEREGIAPEHVSPGRHAVQWLGIGAGLALLALANAVLLAMITGWARVEAGSPALGSLGFALIRAAAIGVREELLYRGVVLHAVALAGLPARVGVVFASLAGAASIALVPGAQCSGVVLTAVLGLAAAVVWQKSGSAWAAVGLHAAWSFGTGIGLRGGLLDVTWSSGGLGEGVKAAGAPAVFAALALLVATALFRRTVARARALPPGEGEPPAPPSEH